MSGKGKAIFLGILVLICFQARLNGQNDDPDREVRAEVREFLKKFQDGYTGRDLAKVGAWVRELMTEDVCVMGTNGVFPNTGEWQTGIGKAEELFANDWKRWGVFAADIDHADIRILTPDVVTVAMTATVTKSPENGFGRSNEENMERCLKRLAELEKDATKAARLKLFTAIWDAGVVLKNTELGDTFVWPVRISMVLIKKEGNWKMTQTHYSYPMSGYPPVRLIDGQVVAY